MRQDYFKRPILFSSMLCAIALFTTGCSNDNEPFTENPDGRVALQLTGGISALTRASGKTWDAGDKIGIYMYKAGTDKIAEGVENVSYVTDGTGVFKPVSSGSTIYFPVDGSNVDFYAWYPNAPLNDNGVWQINLENQRSQKDIDLMTAEAKSEDGEGKTTYHKNQPKVNLSFQHRLTKLVVNIKAGDGISDADLEGLTVEITQQVSTAIYDLDFRSIGYAQELVTIPLLITDTDKGPLAEAILFPDNLAKAYSIDRDRQLVFTLSKTGEKFYYDIDRDKSFNEGEKNIYNITVNRIGLDVTATIEDWTPGNGTGEPGSAE